MYSRLARTSLGALTALMSICTVTGTAYADTKSMQKCSAAIIKAGASFVQAEAKILQKCRETVLKGKLCDPGKTTDSIGKARTKLTSTIVKACQGKDKSCNTLDADGSQPTLAEIGWGLACPGFEDKNCTNSITDCDDIPICLQCIGEASVNQAIDLYYPPGRPASTGNKVLNKCQATIGKAAVTFLGAKSKALAKCWGTKVKKTADCPANAQASIDAARKKLVDALAKPCPGLDNSTIGLRTGCPAVTPAGAAGTCSASVGGPVSTLVNVGKCVSCVTEFNVDCPDRVSARSVGAPYPPECLVALPTATPTPTATATPTPTLTTGPTATATPSGFCGDNLVQLGEFCDGTGTGGACGPSFTCTNCNCACPSKVHFAADAAAPESILDTGWTGISHRAPIITNGDVTVALSGCAGSSRPCGQCNVSGPIANTKAGAGELDSQRCSNDTAVRCTSNTPCHTQCLGGSNDGAPCTVASQCPSGTCEPAGTCEFIFGSDLPLAAGGVTTCVVNQFNGAVSGTANVESGEAVNNANLIARVYNGVAIDNPCPRCTDAGGINDGVLGGTCDAGPRVGLACDANGIVPGRPDFGRTSLDCPPNPLGIIATLPIDLSNATNAVTRTVTASSPNCGDGSGQKCLCDTCNNAAATPCQSNADCVAVGATVCGGKRCLGGTNNGNACPTTTACPGGGICGKAGEPSKPSACLDDTLTANILDCTDTAPVDGEGECTLGPVTSTCSAASGHGQRACGNDGECGGGAGSCVAANRPCFLTGTATGFPATSVAKVGTQTLIANGMADPPMSDTSLPTLAAVFCVGPTTASAVNSVAGLPGPGRVTIKGQATGLP